MITLKTIRQTVIDWIEDDSDPDLVDRTINGQLRFVCKREFEALHCSADATPDETGMVSVPPACATVLGIYPQIAYGALAPFSFMARTTRPRSDEPRTNRYLFHPWASTRSAEFTDVLLGGARGDVLLTDNGGATPVAQGMIGKELRISGDNTRYSVTDVVDAVSITVFPPLQHASSVSLDCTVNPIGVKRYILTDPSGNVYTRPVTFDYQIDHPPLVLDDDELLIPMERTIALLTVQQFLQQSKYDVDAERLQAAVFEARLVEYGTEPSNQQDNAPKDTTFAFRSKRRGGTNRR